MPYLSGDLLGAYDEAKYREYQEAVRTGRGWIPNDQLEDPNGGIIFFDEAGEQDHYQPAARPAGPTDNLPATQDSQSPFYGWTMYEAAAFNTARGATGIHTDFLLARPKPWSAADLAENDRQLREFAANSPKVQAALQQAATGPFRGEARQAEFEANERLAIENAAKEILSDWLADRHDNIARGRGFAWTIPLMPPAWFYGTDVTAAVLARLRELVAQLPPAPTGPPSTPSTPSTTTPPAVTTTSSVPAVTTSTTATPAASADANYRDIAPRAMPSDLAPLFRDGPDGLTPLELTYDAESRRHVVEDVPASAAVLEETGGLSAWMIAAGGVLAVVGIGLAVSRSGNKRR